MLTMAMVLMLGISVMAADKPTPIGCLFFPTAFDQFEVA
jgi:hypothetical protein